MTSHPPCVCGHSWSAHLPLAGSTVGRCTVDCLDRCGEYIASAPRQGEPDPGALDTAAIRAEHAEFCCWCSPVEACRLLALCTALDASRADTAKPKGLAALTAVDRDIWQARAEAAEALAERRRLAWLSACRDRSRIRHEMMWALQGELEGAQQLRDQAAAALDAEHARNERLVTQAGHVLNDLTAANKRAEQAKVAMHLATCDELWCRAYRATGSPTHLPLAEVLELAADLARRTSAPPEAGHG